MKKSIRVFVMAFLACLLSGCFLQSLQPFNTKDLVVELPAIEGQWVLVKEGDTAVTDKYLQPWLFGKEKVTAFAEGLPSDLGVTYFKVEGTTFVDIVPYDFDDFTCRNRWWLIHVVPVHTVCRVELSGNGLKMVPLDGTWVAGMLENKQLSLAHAMAEQEEDTPVLTATTEELVLFLKQYGQHAKAFPASSTLHFQRLQTKNGSPTSQQGG